MALISICIPAFNEAENLPIAVQKVEELFTGSLKRHGFEIIVTDNASTDSTWSIIKSLGNSKPYIKGYQFSRNFGYQNSIFAGLSLATGDAVVELDADLEDPPMIIEEFVKKWEEGFQVVYGVRRTRHLPWYAKPIFAAYYFLFSRLSDIDIPRNSGDFRLLDRKVINVLRSLPERNLYLRGLVSYLGFKQTPVVYDRHPRHSGTSKFRFRQYFVLAIDAITAFSKTPLRLMAVIGLFVFGISMLLSGYYLYERFHFGTPIPGFTTLAILSLFLHGITLIFIGVLGEYLSRIFDDSKFRPRVVISESVNSPDFPTCL
jgi:polyisoprenyl-phosphate glycosyltransferase